MKTQSSTNLITLINRCINAATSDDWTQFLNHFDKYIRMYIRKYFSKQGLALNCHLLDDLVQDVYVKLLMDDKKALRSFAGSTDCSFLSYLSAISQSIAGMYSRQCNANKRKAQILPLDFVLSVNGEFSDKESDCQADILQFELDDLMSKMPGNKNKRDKLIFDLYLEGFTPKEIAGISKLEIEQPTVEAAIKRTKNKLHASFYAMAA